MKGHFGKHANDQYTKTILKSTQVIDVRKLSQKAYKQLICKEYLKKHKCMSWENLTYIKENSS